MAGYVLYVDSYISLNSISSFGQPEQDFGMLWQDRGGGVGQDPNSNHALPEEKQNQN